MYLFSCCLLTGNRCRRVPCFLTFELLLGYVIVCADRFVFIQREITKSTAMMPARLAPSSHRLFGCWASQHDFSHQSSSSHTCSWSASHYSFSPFITRGVITAIPSWLLTQLLRTFFVLNALRLFRHSCLTLRPRLSYTSLQLLLVFTLVTPLCRHLWRVRHPALCSSLQSFLPGSLILLIVSLLASRSRNCLQSPWIWLSWTFNYLYLWIPYTLLSASSRLLGLSFRTATVGSGLLLGRAASVNTITWVLRLRLWLWRQQGFVVTGMLAVTIPSFVSTKSTSFYLPCLCFNISLFTQTDWMLVGSSLECGWQAWVL